MDNYQHTRTRIDDRYKTSFDEINLNGPTELYLTEGGFDITRSGKPRGEWTDPSAGRNSDILKKSLAFTVRAGDGRIGTLLLPVPALLTIHKVDMDGIDTGLGVAVYKELTLMGRVSSSMGIFRSANRSTNYTLVLQGRGNGFDNVSDFTRCRLELNGPRAKYAYFGKVSP